MKLIQFVSQHILFFFLATAALIVFFKIKKRENSSKEARKKLKKTIQQQQNEPLTLHPEIDPALCAGCGACTRACPEGDIIKLINHKATLVTPAKCVGHGECEAVCPTGAIALAFGTKTRGMDIPRLTSEYETNVSGLYIAGELGGMGLIRNAVKQGKLAASHALKKLPSEKSDYDVIVIGAGPAGLAASLTAIKENKTYLCIEQNSFGGTVSNFPRQKIVMSHPLDLPMIGPMKFPENKITKEQLLKYWSKVKKQTGFQVKEKTKFVSLEKKNNIFHLQTSAGSFTSKKVILAMGVRGSPRKLNVPGEELAKVTYNLVEPEQYQEKSIVVIGGGNAGVEAAQMLCKSNWKNKVHLLVRSQSFDRCNEENIHKIKKLESMGAVNIWFQSTVKEIHPDKILIQKGNELSELKNDFVFIFAGAEMPQQFLMSLGIKIEKKFGEGLSKRVA